MSLRGKCALITGSSRGIGRGIAVKLAENGVKIAVHYYQNEQAARTLSRPSATAAPTGSLSRLTCHTRTKSPRCSGR